MADNRDRPQREYRWADRRGSKTHLRFRGPRFCPLDHGPWRRTPESNRSTTVLRTASRASETCVAVSPARLERAACRFGLQEPPDS